MQKEITAQQIVDRIRSNLGASWKDSPRDIFTAGRADTILTGVATAFAPSLDVLQRAVKAKQNLIVTQQPAFYQEGGSTELLKNDPAYLAKKNLIDQHKLVIWRFTDNWGSRSVDGQQLGLAKFLGWEKYQTTGRYFRFPETTLAAIVANMEQKLNIRGIRVIGDPQTRITKASLSHGMFKLSELREILKEKDVDLVVAAEVIEWESTEYFRDLLTTGKKKGMIVLGRAVSEDPGYGEVASWLRTFIDEVPVSWISTTEPFRVP